MYALPQASRPLSVLCLQKSASLPPAAWMLAGLWYALCAFVSFFYLFFPFFSWKRIPASSQVKGKVVMDFSRWKPGPLATVVTYQKREEQNHLCGTRGHLWNPLSTVKPSRSGSTAAGTPVVQRQIELPEIRLGVTRLTLSMAKLQERLSTSALAMLGRESCYKSCCAKRTRSTPAS